VNDCPPKPATYAGGSGRPPPTPTAPRQQRRPLPPLLDIDVWVLLDSLRQASAATDPAARVAALRRAVDAHTGLLADGYDYDWIEQSREYIHRCGIRARLQLAELIAEADPRQATDLTRAAADLNPSNEDLARRAMRALARIGDVAGIRAQLQRLRDALDDIDEEPSAESIALAAELLRTIGNAGGSQGDDPPDGMAPADQ
jgi:DNA-binding SARP family transcriptional activator